MAAMMEMRRRRLCAHQKPHPQIAAEQQIVLRGIKAAVSERVPRQMHHPQPAPERQFVAVGDRHIDFPPPVPGDRATRRLQHATHPRGP
jgi:hypothetical protein